MSTTTIRLPDELKERVTRAAALAGTSTHAFIIQAVAEKVDETELRDRFRDLAQLRYAQILASGETIPWSEMRGYLTALAVGEDLPPPKPRKLGS